MLDCISYIKKLIHVYANSGITLSALWNRLTVRKPEFPLKLDDSCRNFLWTNIVAVNDALSFYELPEPRPELMVHDRTELSDESTDGTFEQVSHQTTLFFNNYNIQSSVKYQTVIVEQF
jgi:hypothetical protein